ncbi:hypothetical protein GCM10027445_11540 [Amycolatopsis endophytica]|uniref:DUF3558 domain-containing protein n=1 Tax=Amycolatopsis endophytica TaxID=860233 RepID=A0A853B3E8_9PSEU|nr:DUF3558 family protein [Amycolatopsis endophytica]NYI89291.1 hypothetical protein [Amycolatopsis endophytica]
MRRRIQAVVVSTIALLGLAACSSGDTKLPGVTSGAPVGSTTSQTSETTEVAPAVHEPLDASQFITTPCKSLTEQQTRDLTITERNEQAGPNDCTWEFGANLEWTVQLFYATVTGGLQNDYNKNSAGFYDHGGYFEPTSVSDYPAVFSNLSDFRASGTCDLNVGIGGDTIFHVTVTGQAGEDNCKAATTVAANVIKTIRTGG